MVGRARHSAIDVTVWELNGAARRLYEELGYTTDARRLRRVLPSTRVEVEESP
jgi:ribosomal protein S18 acetylase RimI-like enzyme